MDLSTALRLGQLVSAAYSVPANDLTSRAAKSVSAGTRPSPTRWSLRFRRTISRRT
jgi:hypothetical protein